MMRIRPGFCLKKRESDPCILLLISFLGCSVSYLQFRLTGERRYCSICPILDKSLLCTKAACVVRAMLREGKASWEGDWRCPTKKTCMGAKGEPSTSKGHDTLRRLVLLFCVLDLFPAEWEIGIRMWVRLQQESPSHSPPGSGTAFFFLPVTLTEMPYTRKCCSLRFCMGLLTSWRVRDSEMPPKISKLWRLQRSTSHNIRLLHTDQHSESDRQS